MIVILCVVIIFGLLFLTSDGCARTGTFITISYALDRMKVDGIIDIFHAVKSSRINRAGLVANAVSSLCRNSVLL